MGGIAAASALYLLLEALYFEKYFFEVKKFAIGNKKSRKQIRILLLTDLHFSNKVWPWHRKLARTINQLRPDLILISGDLIDQYGKPRPAAAFLSLLDKAVPKLAIPGNHDHVNDVSMATLRKLLEQNNGRLLINETQQVYVGGTAITITGLDDFIEGKSNVEQAMRTVDHSKHHLMLVHSPLQHEVALKELGKLNAARATDNKVKLEYIFAGHNHGGQVRLGPIVPVLPEKSGNYINGWYNKRRPYLYVSKGFGTSSVPFRFGARSEITLFSYGV